MAFCNNNAPCGDECSRQDDHGSGCDCGNGWCKLCRTGFGPTVRMPPAAPSLAAQEWIQTFTGRAYFPLAPRVQDVVIEDIAHALAYQCRFTGHTRGFYSVAQHSVLIALVLPKELALEGLFHDASEAYLLDLARPIKYHPALAQYRTLEERNMQVIRHAFALRGSEPDEVKAADKRMLPTERRDLMRPCPAGHKWQPTPEPYDLPITPWAPDRAEQMFLAMARLLRPSGPAGSLPAWGFMRDA